MRSARPPARKDATSASAAANGYGCRESDPGSMSATLWLEPGSGKQPGTAYGPKPLPTDRAFPTGSDRLEATTAQARTRDAPTQSSRPCKRKGLARLLCLYCAHDLGGRPLRADDSPHVCAVKQPEQLPVVGVVPSGTTPGLQTNPSAPASDVRERTGSDPGGLSTDAARRACKERTRVRTAQPPLGPGATTAGWPGPPAPATTPRRTAQRGMSPADALGSPAGLMSCVGDRDSPRP